jgi:putative toxin-antitoxin system antitoxin component (TIGR02293 family)
MTAQAKFMREVDAASLPIAELVQLVGEGLPTPVLDRVATAYGLTQQAMADLIDVPTRTLQRRRAAGRFDKGESERLYRYIRMYQRALDVFDGDDDSARQFLTETQPGLDGAVPVEFARSELGASEVIDLLGRIDLGVYT